jgi:hypothetical protein
MSKPRIHLVIGTPCYGGLVTNLYASSLMKLQHACAKRGDVDLTVLMLGGDALITRARQDITAQFLETATATHLLFIDADIGFEPDQVFRLLDFDADMVAGVYPTKRHDWKKAAAAAKGGREPMESDSLCYVLEFESLEKAGERNGFCKVRYAGTGFLIVKRETLLKMNEKYPELQYAREHRAQDSLRDSKFRFALFNCMIDEATGTYLSEDFSFCRRWTDMGGEIWADLQSRLIHVGPVQFNGNVATQFPTAPSPAPK